jgi:protein TonB
MFLFNSHESNLADRNLTPPDGKANLIARNMQSALTGEEHPRFIGGLLLLLVLLLHVWIGLWLLSPADESPKAPASVLMEVSLISTPGQTAPITPPAPPKPEPPKKQPAKVPVKKNTPVIPKQVELPKPQTLTDEKPAVSNVAPISAPQAVSQPPVDDEAKISTGVIPLERVPPVYPTRAVNRHIEGWVKIEFTITTSGTVEDAVVVMAEPTEIFDDAALKAINQWKFKEKIVNGVAVEQRAVQTLQFKLTK